MLSRVLALRNHKGFKKYLFNTNWLFAEQGLRILSGLLVGAWVARYLGPDQFGVFSYVLAFTAIFAGIAKVGLDGIMVRELVNHPERRNTYLGTAFWLKIFGAFIVMGLMAAIVPFTSNDDTTNLFIFIIAAGLVFQSFEVVEFYFQSKVLAKIVSICKVIQLALSSIIKIYLVFIEAELIWFVLLTAFDTLSLGFSYFIAYRLEKNPNFLKYFDFSTAKELLKDSLPLIFSSIVVMIYMRIDQIMIKEMLGNSEAGIYSGAVRLTEAFYFVPVIVTTSLFPAILKAKKLNEEVYLLRLQRLYNILVIIAIGFSLLMTFLSDWLILVLYGQVYKEAGHVLMISVWASIFVSMGTASGKWYIVENFQRFKLINVSIGAILNVGLNLIGIPKYGITGAAWATLISYFFAGYLMDATRITTRSNFCMLTKSLYLFWKL
jgi:O-antigen/teichoic acid export membrane protein